MRSQIRVLLAIAVSFCLSACGGILVPGGKKLEKSYVCGSLEGRDCAPSTGAPYTSFSKQRKTLELDVAGDPRVLTYLGAVVRKDSNSGDPGTFCGVPGLVNEQDVAPSSYGSEISVEYTLESKYGGELNADIAQGLRAVGVPEKAMESVEADLKLLLDRIKNQQLSSKARFVEYRLTQAFLDKMEAGIGEDVKACLNDLASGRFKMYQALTGFQVSKASFDEDRTNQFISEFGAKLKSSLEENDIAGIEASIRSTTNRIVNIATDPFFEVVGVSYWRSIRHDF